MLLSAPPGVNLPHGEDVWETICMIRDIIRAAIAGDSTMQLTTWMEFHKPADGLWHRLGHEAFVIQKKLMKHTAERNGQRKRVCVTADTNLPFNAEECEMAYRGRTQEMIVTFVQGDATTVLTVKSGMTRLIIPRGLLREAARTPSGARSVADKPCSRCCEELIYTSAEETRTRELLHTTGIKGKVIALGLGEMTHVGIDNVMSIGTKARARSICMFGVRQTTRPEVNTPR